jgi:hypothetical protein
MSDEVKIDFATVRDQMAGLLPMSSDAEWSFTPPIYMDVPEQFRPVFKIKQLKMSQCDEIRSIMSGKTTISEAKVTAKFLDILYSIFVGWDNLYDLSSGNLFEYDGTKEKMMSIPHHVLMSVFEESIVVSGIVPRTVIKSLLGR